MIDEEVDELHEATGRPVRVAPEACKELLGLDGSVRDGILHALGELEAGRASGRRLLSIAAGSLTGELFAISEGKLKVRALYVVLPQRYEVVGVAKRAPTPRRRRAPKGASLSTGRVPTPDGLGLERRHERMHARGGGESLGDLKTKIITAAMTTA